ncbi:hypothetical protein SY83_18980 [Paenibacillus swuensis]|uniref:Putative restriction endonuclease domain-containing protein n=2 Tax=Paenibacillus swuensis TaxID=1178515 RepID=A0A172TQ43_9BACL|nr:hypothetical protein SY83_18980 [Paenibacillus swuensis]
MHLHRRDYTYSEYLTWPDGERLEIIDGDLYAMTPAPSKLHQIILGNLHLMFGNYLKNKKCKTFLPPFDVRLAKPGESDKETSTVVQPDLSIICDPDKLDDRGCKGAPDLIVEIISPGSLKLDLTVKKRLYERFGVREYWIVYPQEGIVMIHELDEHGVYTDGETYDREASIPVRIFQGFTVAAAELFAQ